LHRVPQPLAYVLASLSWPLVMSSLSRSFSPLSGSRALGLWLPVVAWAAVIFALSSIPSLNSGLGTWDFVLRKIAHASEYAILAALLWRALSRRWPALIVAVAYAVTDELHQHFVRGRTGSARDVLIDAGGAVVGLLAHSWYRRRLSRGVVEAA
jgi:VanZ family protein